MARSSGRSPAPTQSGPGSPPRCATTPTSYGRSRTSRRCATSTSRCRGTGPPTWPAERGGAPPRPAPAGRAARRTRTTSRPVRPGVPSSCSPCDARCCCSRGAASPSRSRWAHHAPGRNAPRRAARRHAVGDDQRHPARRDRARRRLALPGRPEQRRPGPALGDRRGGPALAGGACRVPNEFNPIDLATPPTTARSAGTRSQFTAPPAPQGRSWEIHFEEVRRTRPGVAERHADRLQLRPLRPVQPARDEPQCRDGSNTLVVRVDNLIGPGSFPEDWWNWGGIMRPVTLEPLGRLVLRDAGVMPELSCNYRCGDLLVQGTAAEHLERCRSAPASWSGPSPRRADADRSHRVGSPRAREHRSRSRSASPVHGPPDVVVPATTRRSTRSA